MKSPAYKSHAILAVAWSNPYAECTGVAPILWECCIPWPFKGDYDQLVIENAPAFELGSGYSYHITIIPVEGKKWSRQAKARNRKKRLRRRLEKRFSLFADMFYFEEVSKRRAYFDGYPPQYQMKQ